MEDYYTIENLKNEIRKSNFLKIQRAIYPIISKGMTDGDLISQLLLEDYYERLLKNGIDVQNFDIDKWLYECRDEKLDEFVSLVNPDISSKSFSEYSYDEMKRTNSKIYNSIYHGFVSTVAKEVSINYLGNKFYVNNFKVDKNSGNLVPYMHYNYDKKIRSILVDLREKADIKFVGDRLREYGLDNFEDFSYDQISTLLMAILSKKDYEVPFDSLIRKIDDILEYYDRKSMTYNLNKLQLKYLDRQKLNRLFDVLNLARMSDSDLYLIYESEMDLNLVDMYEAEVFKLMYDDETILKAFDFVCEEIKKRRNTHFNREALYYADLIIKDLNNNGKRKQLRI